MCQDVGKALEDISRATGAVAHFYKTLEMGSAGAQARCNIRQYEAPFTAIVQEVGSVRELNGAAGAPSG
jgi:hypothetical protein